MNKLSIDKTLEGNFSNKYDSQNPLTKYLVENWINTLKELALYKKEEIKSIIDAGCGEGFITSKIHSLNIAPIEAFDYSQSIISEANNNYKCNNLEFFTKSIYDFNSQQKADLVCCLEVLEHLEDPQQGLEKIHTITNKYCLLSVPNEPLWRIMNFARGKYIKDLGNTPGHLNHWSKRSFTKFIEAKFKIINCKTPLPWTVLLCAKK